MNDALGDRMKEYEMAEAGRRLMPLVPTVARIDGRCFSGFTRGLARPYDVNLAQLMINTTKYLVEETNANCGYTQSDEITLVWHVPTTRSEMFFDGRVQKIQSVVAGMTTAYFLYHCPAFLPAGYAEKLPHFDCRAWLVPTREEAANVFLWREWDATKNNISMAAQHYYSHTELMNKSGADKQEMLFRKGVNWSLYPDWFKRGSYVQRRKTVRRFAADELEKLPPKHEARANPDLTYERTDYVRVDMPPLARVVNRAAVILDGEAPVTDTNTEQS